LLGCGSFGNEINASKGYEIGFLPSRAKGKNADAAMSHRA
jgi:hypothetical protein